MVFDTETKACLACFQRRHTVSPDTERKGDFDPESARALLGSVSDDRWVDNGFTARSRGYKYKISIPVHHNRSFETDAKLFNADNQLLLTFRVRTHGYDMDGNGERIDGIPWPDFNDEIACNSSNAGCVGANQFTSNGMTPTGLSEIDLNSPEPDPQLYGPYPVNRVVKGLEGIDWVMGLTHTDHHL